MTKNTSDGYVSQFQDKELYATYNSSQVWLGVILENQNNTDDNSLDNFVLQGEILYKNPLINIFYDSAINVLDNSDHLYKICHINRNGKNSTIYYKDKFDKRIKDKYVVVPYREYYYDKIKSMIQIQNQDNNELAAYDLAYLIDLYIDCKSRALVKENNNEKTRTI